MKAAQGEQGRPRGIKCAQNIITSEYNFEGMVKVATKEIILVEQNNYPVVMMESNFFKNLAIALDRIDITMIFTEPHIMHAIEPLMGARHMKEVLLEIRNYCANRSNSDRLKIKFHSGASSLSYSLVDKDLENGIMTFMVKSSHDLSPTDRVYVVLERQWQKHVFDRIISPLVYMEDKGNKTDNLKIIDDNIKLIDAIITG